MPCWGITGGILRKEVAFEKGQKKQGCNLVIDKQRGSGF